MNIRGHRVFPLVTGTFGVVDFFHSVSVMASPSWMKIANDEQPGGGHRPLRADRDRADGYCAWRGSSAIETLGRQAQCRRISGIEPDKLVIASSRSGHIMSAGGVSTSSIGRSGTFDREQPRLRIELFQGSGIQCSSRLSGWASRTWDSGYVAEL